MRAAAGGAALAAGRAGAGAGAGRMLAWRVHQYGAGEPRLETARVPVLRAPDELLVRVAATSVNPIDVAMIGGYGRTVLNALRGLEAARGRGAEGVEFPLVPGRDFLGAVERAGAGAARGRGDEVWGVLPPHWPGAHQEYVVVKERWTGTPPARLGLAAGGALYAGLTATSALRAAGLPAGRPRGGGGGGAGRALVLGLGAVGHTALQLLVADGHEVVVGCAGELRARAEALGAARALDCHAPDYDEQLVAAGPYSAIIDCAGLGGVEAGARRWRFARYVTLSSPLLRATDARGLAAGGAGAALQLAAQCWAAARAAGGAGAGAGGCAPLPPHVRWAYFTPNQDDIELLRRRAESGQLTVPVECVFPWWEADLALARAARGHARGKLLLDFTQPGPAHRPTAAAHASHASHAD